MVRLGRVGLDQVELSYVELAWLGLAGIQLSWSRAAIVGGQRGTWDGLKLG